MQKYKSIYEAKQVNDIYHFTTMVNFLDIVGSDYILKSSSYSGTMGGLSNKKLGYVSFTRNFNLPAAIRSRLDVRFDIDGNNLSNRYKISPFLDKYANIKRPDEENEERIVSNTVNLKPYINCIVIKKRLNKIPILKLNKTVIDIIDNEYYDWAEDYELIPYLEDILYKDKIPLYFVHEFLPNNRIIQDSITI